MGIFCGVHRRVCTKQWIRTFAYAKFVLAASLMASLLACGGDRNEASQGDQSGTDNAVPVITGKIFDSVTGGGIVDTVVFTIPATTQVRSDRDGAYELSQGLEVGVGYQIVAYRLGYNEKQYKVTAIAGRLNTDLAMQSVRRGLVADLGTLEIGGSESEGSFLLTSTVANTGFSIQTSNSWISVTPRTGMISQNERKIIRVAIDRAAFDDGDVSSRIVVNSDNGTDGVVVDLVVNRSSSSSDDDSSSGGGSNPDGGESDEPKSSMVNCDYRLPCAVYSRSAEAYMNIYETARNANGRFNYYVYYGSDIDISIVHDMSVRDRVFALGDDGNRYNSSYTGSFLGAPGNISGFAGSQRLDLYGGIDRAGGFYFYGAAGDGLTHFKRMEFDFYDTVSGYQHVILTNVPN